MGYPVDRPRSLSAHPLGPGKLDGGDRVRQALFYGLDRDTLVDTLLSGLATRADFFAHPDDPTYKLAEQRGLPKYPFNVTQSERLMADAGWIRGGDGLFRNSSGQTIDI